MKKRRVVLMANHSIYTTTYQVKKLYNCISPKVDSFLSEKDVTNLISDNITEVEILGDKK